VVDALVARGVPVRVGDRAPARLARRAGTEAVRFDFAEARTFAGAAGCGAAFVLRPPAIAKVKPTLNAFIDAARADGVDAITFLSVAGAGANPLVPHHAVEQHLIARGGAYTILRPGFFAQNLGDAYRRDIVEDRRIYVPAGSGVAAFVDVRDVGEVAALALCAPDDHRGQAYTLTGPVAVDFAAAAALLSAALGHAIRYEPASVIGYARHLRRRGLPVTQIAVQTVLHVGLRLGQARAVDPTLGRLLGRAPRSLATYVADHVATWR
jgi:uncharacterized protein YbjT (DUF2867 family)